jgi:hypothetical protein
MNASIGYGNYNALFISLKTQAWHGVIMQSNFTWSKTLGTGTEVQATSEAMTPDVFNLQTGYGYQAFDRRYIYNLFIVYQPNFYKGQSGIPGTLPGWLDVCCCVYRWQRIADNPRHDQGRWTGVR